MKDIRIAWLVKYFSNFSSKTGFLHTYFIWGPFSYHLQQQKILNNLLQKNDFLEKIIESNGLSEFAIVAQKLAKTAQ